MKYGPHEGDLARSGDRREIGPWRSAATDTFRGKRCAWICCWWHRRRVLRLSEDDQAANTHAHGELFHHAAIHPVRGADHLPRLQSRRATPVPGALRPSCLGLSVRVRRLVDRQAPVMTKSYAIDVGMNA